MRAPPTLNRLRCYYHTPDPPERSFLAGCPNPRRVPSQDKPRQHPRGSLPPPGQSVQPHPAFALSATISGAPAGCWGRGYED